MQSVAARMVLAAILGSASSVGVAQVAPAAPVYFDRSEVAWAEQPGFSTVRVNSTYAFEAKQFGCKYAFLIPSSRYGEQVLRWMYGDDLASTVMLTDRRKFPKSLRLPKAQDKEWMSKKRWVEDCDPSGNASFIGVPPGNYFVELMYITGKTYGLRSLRNPRPPSP